MTLVWENGAWKINPIRSPAFRALCRYLGGQLRALIYFRGAGIQLFSTYQSMVSAQPLLQVRMLQLEPQALDGDTMS